jgi:hypothetical protein
MDTSFLPESDPLNLMQIIDRTIAAVNTAIPGTVKAFNAATQTATIVPNIKAINHTIDGQTFNTPLPDLIEVPCLLMGSNMLGLTVTIPIQKGDQCLIIFSQRSIDNWLKYSGVQDPVEPIYPRHHSLCDGIAIVGLYPQIYRIDNYDQDAIVIRNKNKSVYIKVSQTEVVAKAPVITLDGNVVITGTVTGTGGTPVLTGAGISHGGKTIDAAHAHKDVQGGSGNSGGIV